MKLSKKWEIINTVQTVLSFRNTWKSTPDQRTATINTPDGSNIRCLPVVCFRPKIGKPYVVEVKILKEKDKGRLIGIVAPIRGQKEALGKSEVLDILESEQVTFTRGERGPTAIHSTGIRIIPSKKWWQELLGKNPEEETLKVHFIDRITYLEAIPEIARNVNTQSQSQALVVVSETESRESRITKFHLENVVDTNGEWTRFEDKLELGEHFNSKDVKKKLNHIRNHSHPDKVDLSNYPKERREKARDVFLAQFQVGERAAAMAYAALGNKKDGYDELARHFGVSAEFVEEKLTGKKPMKPEPNPESPKPEPSTAASEDENTEEKKVEKPVTPEPDSIPPQTTQERKNKAPETPTVDKKATLEQLRNGIKHSCGKKIRNDRKPKNGKITCSKCKGEISIGGETEKNKEEEKIPA